MREIIIKVMGTHRKVNERSLENLRPFNTLPPEEQRKIARLGGIASGAKRRYKADLRLAMIEQLAGMQLAEETREEFRAAIQRYVREERKKRTGCIPGIHLVTATSESKNSVPADDSTSS